jgi:hypothetical protein
MKEGKIDMLHHAKHQQLHQSFSSELEASQQDFFELKDEELSIVTGSGGGNLHG